MLSDTPRIDASHIAAALDSYGRELRRNGRKLPAALTELQQVMVGIAIGSIGSAGDHTGSRVAPTYPDFHDGAVTTDTLLCRAEAAKRLACSVSTLKRRESAGDLPAFRHGRLVRYRVADLDGLTTEQP